VFVAGTGRAPGDPPRKLASIGVGLRGWITCHGFALNVTLDPGAFDVIVPCGLHEVRMSSVAHELGPRAPADLDARARAAVADAFRRRLATPASARTA
jgi:lipoyl(octanoyl) transferase